MNTFNTFYDYIYGYDCFVYVLHIFIKMNTSSMTMFRRFVKFSGIHVHGYYCFAHPTFLIDAFMSVNTDVEACLIQRPYA